MEKKLGRTLKRDEFVIRLDRNPANNDPSNFKVVSAQEARSHASYKELTYYVDSNGCHVCTSHTLFNGYPSVYRNGRRQQAHRFIYEQEHGPIAKGLVLRHRCDNPACINLNHLETGTPADNARDMYLRGRSCGKFSRQDILKIRRSNKDTAQLAVEYGVHRSTIARIRSGTSWKHIN